MSYLRKHIDAETAAATVPVLQCDYCAGSTPVWVYAAARSSKGEASPSGVILWRWMACADCARDVENSNWNRLERRMTEKFKQIFASRDEYKDASESLIAEGVRHALEDFHNYAVHIMDPGTGKTKGAL